MLCTHWNRICQIAMTYCNLLQEKLLKPRSVPKSLRVRSGRIVGIVKRNWRQYCGILQKSVLKTVRIIWLPWLFNVWCTSSVVSASDSGHGGTGFQGRHLRTAVQVSSVFRPISVNKSRPTFSWGKGGKVSSPVWEVKLCDLVWHGSSCSGEAVIK